MWSDRDFRFWCRREPRSFRRCRDGSRMRKTTTGVMYVLRLHWWRRAICTRFLVTGITIKRECLYWETKKKIKRFLHFVRWLARSSIMYIKQVRNLTVIFHFVMVRLRPCSEMRIPVRCTDWHVSASSRFQRDIWLFVRIRWWKNLKIVSHWLRSVWERWV